MVRPIFLGVPVFRADREMVEEAIGSFLDPLVHVFAINNGASLAATAGLEKHRAAIEVLHNEQNVYVNPAWNQIAKRFLESQSKVLVIANEDIVVSRGWAARLLGHALNPGHALSPFKREMWHVRRTADKSEVLSGRCGRMPPPYFSSRGGFFAMTREAAAKVFPIPSDLLIWYGDNWIWNKLHLEGYKVRVLSDVVMWHAESVSQRRLTNLNEILTKDRIAWPKYGLMGKDIVEFFDEDREGTEMVETDEVGKRYIACREQPSDINQHLPLLRAYAEHCGVVAEFGSGRSTWALLHARPTVLRSYDLAENPRGVSVSDIERLGRGIGVDAKFERRSSLELTFDRPVELLFIDTLHTYDQLTAELERHASMVTGHIILHDTDTFGARGEDGKSPGLVGAFYDFLAKHPEWKLKDRLNHNNGLTILARVR